MKKLAGVALNNQIELQSLIRITFKTNTNISKDVDIYFLEG